ncbi:fumarylacetoacetase [Paraburkholderia sp. ZP32-5]|uniref:fumarylacetoacetase n=1 Tax=Paraburkholderia sp. ZP32-5 TaxID=2883245 RepID=UPI001F479EFA|nr:fumarylacetoacetase [Paraburkholderia sp. ZP32-5]
MSIIIDETHESSAQSWVQSANRMDGDFPLQNLPMGVFRTDMRHPPRPGIRIGSSVLDLPALLETQSVRLGEHEQVALRQTTLNAWMALGRRSSSALRRSLFELLHERANARTREAVAACLVPIEDCTMLLPASIGDFTDFYTSIHHARRASEAVRGEATLHPNFQSIPIAYHGRSSSIAVSGPPCHRPYGVTGATSGYRPSEKLDFELEVGFYVSETAYGKLPFTVDEADRHLFGFCLVNDWSARDIQRWEAFPLGPFLAKSFMTTTSAWIVTAEALAPFRVAPAAREPDAPPLAAELTSAAHASLGAIDLSLTVTLQSRLMREAGMPGMVIARPNFKDQYWSAAQMITHHASNGCSLRSGDLISSGTVSGPEREDSGCLLERTRDGQSPFTLPSGESRSYLSDGDTIAFSGRCTREGFRSIGFGACVADVVNPPA